MYCPHCAAQNTDNAKFCRTCGTDLAAVGLVLTNKLPPPGAWLEKYGEGKHKVIMGAILLVAALLIGAVPALFIGVSFPLVMLWTVFFGWMAGWGIVSLATGVGEMVKSKTMLRQMKQFDSGLTTTEPSELSSAAHEPRMLDEATSAKTYPPLSVTEHTTELLGEPPPRG
ncbi:MAG TPA: zinc ribbon domain-containing protein [Pyrinomonadaceae bacterium]|jgi:thiol:disulfide interchange protein